jgi:hypothetical protein
MWLYNKEKVSYWSWWLRSSEATGWTKWVRLRAGVGEWLFSPPQRSDRLRSRPSFHSKGSRLVSAGVKRSARKSDHYHPSSAEVKNTWSYISTSQYVFMVLCLVKQKNICTLCFTIVRNIFVYESADKPERYSYGGQPARVSDIPLPNLKSLGRQDALISSHLEQLYQWKF